jgi:aspartyl-tRNA(Asn)/glutamyl-tRNA(Gln) amidotransferase subunit B
MRTTGDSAAAISEREGLLQVSDDTALSGWIDTVWQSHAAEAQRFVRGEQKLLGVLVGLVMKESKGRADPKRVNQLLASRAGGGGG